MNYTATNVGPYGLRSPYSMFNGLGQLGPGLYNVRAGARFFNDINATSQAFVASGMETVELNNSSGGIAAVVYNSVPYYIETSALTAVGSYGGGGATSSAGASGYSYGTVYYSKGNDVRIRASASTSAQILGVLDKGDQVMGAATTISGGKYNWRPVQKGSVVGFVADNFLSMSRPSAPSAGASAAAAAPKAAVTSAGTAAGFDEDEVFDQLPFFERYRLPIILGGGAIALTVIGVLIWKASAPSAPEVVYVQAPAPAPQGVAGLSKYRRRRRRR